MKLLTMVYKDIEIYGVDKNSQFTEGWMCPIYKKGKRELIENYRPITLLNSDYKISTKEKAIRLAKAAPNCIHKNQAGFMPGRDIRNQVRLARLMVHYDEATKQNGLLIALDQEKTYDKITHDYLLCALETYNFLESFQKTVKFLYENVETSVMINGVLSQPFNVTRGVRQGNPLSHLLFNIVIEPLANLLQQSRDLKGFQIPGETQRLIVTMFTDDTTAYLAEQDNPDHLWKILDTWCIASGAKFNSKKTKIIPIDTQKFREQVIQQRRTNEAMQTLDENIKILQEKEAAHILGGWIRNSISDEAVWPKSIDKVKNYFKRWGKSNPAIFRRRLIIQMFGGGAIQYLAAVQGMPNQVVKTYQKMISKFIWDGKKKAINKTHLLTPLKKGGIHLLYIQARNEAIEIMWMKKYLDTSNNRPLWANIADALIENSIADSNKIDDKLAVNMFLQDWKPCLTHRSKLPPDLKRMISVVKLYGVSLEALALPEKVKRNLPIWYQLGLDKLPNSLMRRKLTKCLKRSHEAVKVGDLIKLMECLNQTNPRDTHQDLQNCQCAPCEKDRTEGCKNPNACIRAAE